MGRDQQSIPKRHHIVSQMQLNRFTDEAGKLHSFNKKAGRLLYGPPKNVFVERHLYSIENEDGTKDTRLEQAFAELEGSANLIIEKIISAVSGGRAPWLSAKEKFAWDLFFYMQWKRAPDMHQKFADEVEAEGNLDEIFASLRQKFPDQTDEIDRLDTPDERRRLMHGSKVMAIASVSEDVMTLLWNRGLAVMKTYAPGEKFIIGSLPIVRFGGELGSDATEAWLPIAPDILVGIGASGSGATLFSNFGQKVVQSFNRVMASQSTIFAGPSKAVIEDLAGSLTNFS